MCHDRHYLVTQDELDQTLELFKEQFGDRPRYLCLKLVSAIFHYFQKKQYASWLFRTKYFEIKFNLQLLYLPIVSQTFILS